MEILKQFLMKPLIAVTLVLQCVFVVFIFMSAPKENGQLRAALSSLRTPSQSNIAPITQNEARELRGTLEQLIVSHKSFTTVSAIFGFVSIALMVTMMLPSGFKQRSEMSGLAGRLKL